MTAKRESYWSRYSASYDADAEYVVGRPLRTAIAERLRAERGLGDMVEFGCGTGFFTRVAAEQAQHIIATDLSDEMLEAAKTRLKDVGNVTVQKEDCERTSFPSFRFDTVLMANVLHTVKDPASALKEAYRILRDRGRLLVVSYTDYGTTWFEKFLLALKYFQKFGMPPASYRNYSPPELAQLAEEAGFAVKDLDLIRDTAKAIYVTAVKYPGPEKQ